MDNKNNNTVYRHPTKDIIAAYDSKLSGKTILLCITGSVALINSPVVARSLMRHGAEIKVAMSEKACELITPTLMEWATGNPVITKITGQIEHIALAGERGDSLGQVDMVIFYPSTGNIISKIAHGIGDEIISTIGMVALGSKTPMIMVPAMHDSMFRNPIIQENIIRLKEYGVMVIEPHLLENKAKIAQPEEIVEYILEYFSKPKDLRGKKFLITAGASREMIDQVRFISNPSTGKMGMAFAKEILSRGGLATILCGSFSVSPPAGAKVIEVKSVHDFIEGMEKELKSEHYDVLISAAALADFEPIRKVEEKISSETDELVLHLKPTPKFISRARELSEDLFICAFKAETILNDEDLINKAYNRLKSSKSNMIVANNVNEKNTGRGFGSDTNEVLIIESNKEITHVPLSSKRDVAAKVLDIIKKYI